MNDKKRVFSFVRFIMNGRNENCKNRSWTTNGRIFFREVRSRMYLNCFVHVSFMFRSCFVHVSFICLTRSSWIRSPYEKMFISTKNVHDMNEWWTNERNMNEWMIEIKSFKIVQLVWMIAEETGFFVHERTFCSWTKYFFHFVRSCPVHVNGYLCKKRRIFCLWKKSVFLWSKYCKFLGDVPIREENTQIHL